MKTIVSQNGHYAFWIFSWSKTQPYFLGVILNDLCPYLPCDTHDKKGQQTKWNTRKNPISTSTFPQVLLTYHDNFKVIKIFSRKTVTFKYNTKLSKAIFGEPRLSKEQFCFLISSPFSFPLLQSLCYYTHLVITTTWLPYIFILQSSINVAVP